MPIYPERQLIVAVTARALFDLEAEHQIYLSRGVQAYVDHQIKNESQVLAPGTAVPLIRALMRLNDLLPNERLCEVILVSRNSAETFLRIRHSIEHHGLDVPRCILTGGEPVGPYLRELPLDVLLSATPDSVTEAMRAGVAAALVYPTGEGEVAGGDDQLRVAFDGDAVLFSGESHARFVRDGLAAFEEHETQHARVPLAEGPLARLLRKLAMLQSRFHTGQSPVRTALVTSRCSPTDERVIRTFREWGIRVDEAFFLGGASKDGVLRAFKPHIYFDDEERDCMTACAVVPVAQVLEQST